MVKQIKSKKRVADYGEVYTKQREVNAMLDLVSDEASCITSTFLEPACGNGNFVIEILKRKMKTVHKISRTSWEYAFNTLRAVASVYGVDIQADNIAECKVRIQKYMMDEVSKELYQYSSVFYEKWFVLVSEILDHNLISGNTLMGTTISGIPLTFSEWMIGDNGYILRRDQLFSDILLGEANYVNETAYREIKDVSFQILA